MCRREYVLMVVLLGVAGLTGGALATWLVSGQAHAERRIIRAQAIELVDGEGNTRIILSAGITPRDYAEAVRSGEIKGRTIPRPGPGIAILDKKGDVIWFAPQPAASFVH